MIILELHASLLNCKVCGKQPLRMDQMLEPKFHYKFDLYILKNVKQAGTSRGAITKDKVTSVYWLVLKPDRLQWVSASLGSSYGSAFAVK